MTPAPRSTGAPDGPNPPEPDQRDTPAATEAAPKPSVIHTQIAEALRRWHGGNTVVCEHTQIVSYGAAADAVMAVPMIRGMWVRLKLTQFHIGAAKAKVEQLTKELKGERSRRQQAEADRDRLVAVLGDCREGHDVRRKALADALDSGWHLSWAQLTTRASTCRAALIRQRDQAEAAIERVRALDKPEVAGTRLYDPAREQADQDLGHADDCEWHEDGHSYCSCATWSAACAVAGVVMELVLAALDQPTDLPGGTRG